MLPGHQQSAALTSLASWQPCAAPARAPLVCLASGGAKKRRARRPGHFEVRVITPPPASLGLHLLPPDTHNGDSIHVNDQDFVVSRLVLTYRLVGGRYERDHNALEVESTGRWLVNRYFEDLYRGDAARR